MAYLYCEAMIEDSRSSFRSMQCNPSNNPTHGLATRVRKTPCMRRRSNPECDGPTGHQCAVPRGSRRLVVLGQGPSPRNESVRLDHRSHLFLSSSVKTSSKLATGAGLGGGPEPVSVGGTSSPDRTASARNASARTEFRASLGGPNSATTRSRSVTKTVSPDAASRTYSLNFLFRTLMPTDLMRSR